MPNKAKEAIEALRSLPDDQQQTVGRTIKRAAYKKFCCTNREFRFASAIAASLPLATVTIPSYAAYHGSVIVKAGYPPEDTLDQSDLAAATWAWQNDRAAGRGADTLPGARRRK